MKEKFNKIKNRPEFYLDAGKKFETKPSNIESNWFGKRFVAVPRGMEDAVEKFIDKYIEMEKDNEKTKLINKQKYLGL